MRERIRAALRWTLPAANVSAAAVWWIFEEPVLAALGAAVAVLQLSVAIRRRLPLVVPSRRKPIVIEQLRWPRG